MIKGIIPKLAECGKIKIGGLGAERPKQGGGTFRLPVKYDYFIVTSTTRNKAGDFETDETLMGNLETDADKRVRSLPIILHSDDIDSVFPTTYALYSGRRCACRGDGETAFRRSVKDKSFTGEEGTVECPCKYLDADSGPKCKPNGQLRCSIAVPGSAIAGAVYIWRTTSIISIEQMIGSLLQIKAICGTLMGIPLWLRVRPIIIQPSGQEKARTVYCCHVELRAPDIAEVQREALEATKRRCELGLDDDEYGKMLALPALGETTDEEGLIANEFYPEDESNTDGDASSPVIDPSEADPEATPEPTPPQSVAERMAQEAAEKTNAKSETKEPEPTAPKTDVVTKPAAREPDPGETQTGSDVAPKMVELILGRLRSTYKMSDEQIKMALGGPIEGAPLEELQRVIDECEKHFLSQKKVGDSKDEQLALTPTEGDAAPEGEVEKKSDKDKDKDKDKDNFDF